MDTKDPSTPIWKTLVRAAFFLLFLGVAILEGFREEYGRAAFTLIFAVWIDLEDKIDSHFGDLRRSETRRAGIYR